MIGELFVGIASRSFGWLAFAVRIGFGARLTRRERAERKAARISTKATAGPPLLTG